MELHHLHVRDPRARAPCHGDPVTRRAARRGRELVHAPRPARRQHGRARDMRHHVTGSLVERIGTPHAARPRVIRLVAPGDQVDAALPGQQRDVRIFLRRLEQRGLHRPAGSIVHMDDAAVRMPAFARQVQVAFLAVEGHAQLAQPVDRGRRAFDHELDRLLVVETRPGDHRVTDVVVERVARVEHRGDAALRPRGGAAVEPALGEHQHALGLRQRQRGGKSGSARTDDEDVVRGVCHARVMPTQSLRGKQGTIRRSEVIVSRLLH